MTAVGEEVLRAVAAYGLPGTTTVLPSSPLPAEVWAEVSIRVWQQGLTGLMAKIAVDGAMAFTAAQRDKVSEDHVAHLTRCLHLERLLLELVPQLAGAGVDVRVLKGPAAARLDYPDPALRPFGDIDLLVRSDQFDEAVAILTAAGHRRRHPQPRPGFDSRFSKGACFKTEAGMEIDLHRTFALGPYGLLVDLDDVWADSTTFTLAGREVRALWAEARFVNAALHAVLGDDPPRLLALRDVAQMASQGDVDLRGLHDLVTRWGVGGVVARAVTHAWATLRLPSDSPMATWAEAHGPLRARDRLLLATYIGPGSGSATRSLGAVVAIRGVTNRVAYLRALAWPSAAYLERRQESRARRWRRGAVALGRGVAGPRRQGRGNEPSSATRVLVLSKGLGRGGAERLIVDGLRHIDRGQFDVEVAYVLPFKDALAGEVGQMGVALHCLGGGLTGSIAWVVRLRRLVRSGGFEIVHTHMPLPALAARLTLGPGRPILVHTEHNTWDRYWWPTRWANALTYRRNSAVFAVAEAVAASIKPPGGTRGLPIEVLVHGIDTGRVRRGPEAREKARADLGLDPGTPVVGHVANFTRKKDQGTLLAAIALLVARRPDLRLVMVGIGPRESALRAHAEALRIEDHIIWAGIRDDVPELLPAFDVFALSSLHEGRPIALIEAMAAGLGCVATDVGGVREVLEHDRTGLVVGPGDPAALAGAVARLLDDASWRATLGEAAVVAAQRMDSSTAARRVLAVYGMLTSG